MSDDLDTPEQSGPARQYQMISLAAVLVLTLGLVARGCAEFSLAPLLLGVVAVFFRWSGGPVLLIMLLIALFALLGPAGLGYFYEGELGDIHPLLDPLLVIALLAYSVAHFRMLGLTSNLFPVDRRNLLADDPRLDDGKKRKRGPSLFVVLALVLLLGPVGIIILVILTGLEDRGKKTARAKPHVRPPETATPNELLVALLTVPLWTAIGFLAWLLLTIQESPFVAEERDEYWPRVRRMARWREAMHNSLWQTVILIWVAVVLLLLATAVLGYLRRLWAPPADNLLYLQDQLWRETRREQSLVNRWLTWARLRRQRRQEES
jgi:hypothetical protein